MLVIATHVAIGGMLVLAAAFDLKFLRIPNPIPLGLAILFVATCAAGLQGALAPHAISFVCASVVSLALFLANIWGGGDTKLTAAMALFLTPGELGRFFLIVALAGGLVAVGVLIARRLRELPPERRTNLPYGVALAVGGLDWCLTI